MWARSKVEMSRLEVGEFVDAHSYLAADWTALPIPEWERDPPARKGGLV